jgi:hypothetical protein
MNLSLPRLEALARLAERHEYAALLAWLEEERTKRTREALQTADARACGAAALLQDLTDTLANVKPLYDHARKTASGSGIDHPRRPERLAS